MSYAAVKDILSAEIRLKLGYVSTAQQCYIGDTMY